MTEEEHAGGREADWYVVAPPEGAGLGVVVLAGDDETGVSVKGFCERLATEGFTALAAGVPHTVVHQSYGSGGEMLPGGAAETLATIVDRLQAHPAVRGHGVGVVGFGRGGAAALALASARPDAVKAVVPFYSVTGPGPAPDWTRLTAAVEGHVAGDAGPTEGGAAALESTLAGSGVDVRMFHYPGTTVGFFDESRDDAYDEEAARQAWVRTLEFLRSKLG